MTSPDGSNPFAFDARLPWPVWATAVVAVAVEWLIIFRWQVADSPWFLRKTECANVAVGSGAAALLSIKIWVVALVVQAILCGAVVHYALGAIARMWVTAEPEGRLRRIAVVLVRAAALALIMSVFLPIDTTREVLCDGMVLQLWTTGLMSFAATGVCAAAMWMIEARISLLEFRLPDEGALPRFIAARERLQMLLAMSSAVLVCGLGGVFARRAMLPFFGGAEITEQKILLEALEYSVLLFLAYAPAHVALNRTAAAIKAELFPVPPVGDGKDYLEWLKDSMAVSDMLRVTWHDWKTMGPGFAVLAPLILTMLGQIVGRNIAR